MFHVRRLETGGGAIPASAVAYVGDGVVVRIADNLDPIARTER